MKCICDSCAKKDKCPEQFMLRHTLNLMNECIPGQHVVGGPGDTPWTYQDWGMSVDVKCKHYEYADVHKLSSCATQIGPHKLRLDFTKTTRAREAYRAGQALGIPWRRILFEEDYQRRSSVYDGLFDEYGIGADDLGIGYLDM